jgi:hypothetical protein
MTTAATIIDQARRDLLAGLVEERNRLSTSMDAVTTVLSVSADGKGIREGAVIEVGAELMYVWGFTAGNAEVERGWDGTTATSHAANSIITVKPRFPTKMLFDHLNDDIVDLSSPTNGLFQIKTLERSYNGSDRAIDLTGVTDIINIHEVRWKYQNDEWPVVRRWRLSRDANPTNFASGLMLILDESVQSSTMRIVYRAPYTRLSSVSDDLTTVGGVQQSLSDVLRMGVQLRAMVGREVKRNFTESQGDTRRADEVGPGAVQASWRGLAALRAQRIEAEQARLSQQYPMRIRK